jgi:hypothetical protein
LTHVRYLLASFPNAPEKAALIQGLRTDVQKIYELASELQKQANNGNRAHMLVDAEAIQNIIVGNESSKHVDADKNGTVEDPSDGFGLLLNGRNLGYLSAVYAEADATVNSTNASQQMIEYGQGLKVSIQNLAQWTPQLQDINAMILSAPAGSDVKQKAAEVVALASKMLNGIDLDADGIIEPVPNEGGAQTAYEQAYHMADMPLQAIGILNIGTGTPTFITVPNSNPGGGNGGSGDAATPRVPPGQQNVPPGQQRKTPHSSNDTTDSGGGGHGNGNSNQP